MGQTVDVKIVLMIDDSGEYILGKDEEICRETWDDEIGHIPSSLASYQITLSLPLPKIEEISGEVAAKGGPLRLVITNS